MANGQSRTNLRLRISWAPPRPITPFEGFSLAEAETLNGDELARVVHWNGESDFASLAGREVALRLHLNKAKVFATAL